MSAWRAFRRQMDVLERAEKLMERGVISKVREVLSRRSG